MSAYALRKLANTTSTAVALACVVLAIIPLGAMLAYVLGQGGSSLNWAFFSDLPQPVGEAGGGMASQIAGTMLLIGIASCIGLPIGIMSGIYLARSTAVRFTHTVRFFTDVIAGTPSIVAGVVAYAVIVITIGFSAWAGGVALGLLMFPTVTRATEEAIKLVPAAIREAGLALGLPEWKTMFRIILPTAINGIVTAVMLGIARVAGETAPLALTVLGNNAYPGSLSKPVGALPLEIWTYAQSPYPDWHRQAWAGAFTLFALVVLLNLGARLLTYRLSKRIRLGAS